MISSTLVIPRIHSFLILPFRDFWPINRMFFAHFAHSHLSCFQHVDMVDLRILSICTIEHCTSYTDFINYVFHLLRYPPFIPDNSFNLFHSPLVSSTPSSVYSTFSKVSEFFTTSSVRLSRFFFSGLFCTTAWQLLLLKSFTSKDIYCIPVHFLCYRLVHSSCLLELQPTLLLHIA